MIDNGGMELWELWFGDVSPGTQAGHCYNYEMLKHRVQQIIDRGGGYRLQAQETVPAVVSALWNYHQKELGY